MITSGTPDNWRGLQQQVASILNECGLTVKIEGDVSTAHGTVEIDVLAEEHIEGRRYTILCECKHWKSRVPQSVIHSFRTVVGDAGANLGYIISSAGFQSGAFTAADLTNIRLMDWQQFQREFVQQWTKKYLVPFSRLRFRTFNVLFNTPDPPFGFELPGVRQKLLTALRNKYGPFRDVLTYCFNKSHPFDSFPAGPDITQYLMVSASWCREVPESIYDAASYRTLLEAAISYTDSAVLEYLRVLDER